MDINLIKKRMGEVIHTTALENTNYDFMATHLPFKNLKYQRRGNLSTTDQILSEQDYFRDNILENRDQHKLIVVQGDNGSGKSHLIRWLYHNYEKEIDPNEDLIILISRGANTLKGALRQIVTSEMFNRIEDGNEFKKLIEASNILNEEEIKEQIAGLLTATINSDKDEEGILPKRAKRYLHSFLSDEVIREKILFVDDGPIDRIASRLTSSKTTTVEEREPKFYPEDFDIRFGSDVMKAMTRGDTKSADRAIELATMIANDTSLEDSGIKGKICKYLNKHIDRVIQSIIKVGQNDLMEVFKEVRSSLKKNNMSLTLFIEDITSFAGINKELMETLLVDHNTERDLCRLISFVGITNSYFNDTLPDNIKDRITDRIIIDDRSLFGSPDDVAGLVARYLNAISHPKESIERWYYNGALEEELPVSSKNLEKEWSTFEFIIGKKLSLFPFSKDALWKIYNGLKVQDRTPRNFINFIFLNILSYYLSNVDNFPPTEEAFSSIQIPRWRDNIYEDIVQRQHEGVIGKKISLLLRLWGNGTLDEEVDLESNRKTIGGVDHQVFRDFGLPIIKGIESNKQGETSSNSLNPTEEVTENNIDLPANNQQITPEIGRREQSSRRMRDYQRYVDELEAWKNGGPLTSHRSLREDVCGVINNFINWEEEGISPLMMRQFITLSNVHIEGQSVRIDSGFVMERNAETYYFLLGIISWRYLGERSWHFDNSEEYILRMTNYIVKYKDNILKVVKMPPKVHKEEWKYEEWMILNSYYHNLINGNFHRVDGTKEDIFDILIKRDINRIEPKFGSIWNSLIERVNKDVDFNQNQRQLIRYYNLILGDANPDTTDNFTMDAHKILKNIQKLMETKWDLKLYIPKSDYRGQTAHFLPLNLIRQYWKDKIHGLIEQETNRVKELVINIEDRHAQNVTVETINNLRISSKRFLEENLNSINLNFDQQAFEYLIGVNNMSDMIYKSYEDCLKMLEIEPNERLILISQSKDKELISYYECLERLNDKIEQTEKELKSRLRSYDKDTINSLRKLESQLSETILSIKSEIEGMLEVN
jgi:hypothetical protein